jgi:hypothetical protein
MLLVRIAIIINISFTYDVAAVSAGRDWNNNAQPAGLADVVLCALYIY